MDEMKEKFAVWLEYVKQTQDVDKSIDKFEELFEEVYETRRIEDVDEYYERIDIYYELSYGIELKAVSGDEDRFGSQVSHIGTDLYLYSKFSKKEIYKEGISLFKENEYIGTVVDLDDVFDM